MTHIEEELNRIGERLAAGPDPFEHAGLYAAQQALSWAAQPGSFKSPYALVTGTRADEADCCSDSCPAPLPDTFAET
jgi:hypothetical protein